jgi:P-type E1-E2 ATPase
LQSIPTISPLSPVTAIAPLVFVLFVSMAREGYEDLLRHRQDTIQNRKKGEKLVFSSNQPEEVEWTDIIVGDILLIKKDTDFPADVIILASSNPDGSAFINTSSLDGEKNLKPKVKFTYKRVFSTSLPLNSRLKPNSP